MVSLLPGSEASFLSSTLASRLTSSESSFLSSSLAPRKSRCLSSPMAAFSLRTRCLSFHCQRPFRQVSSIGVTGARASVSVRVQSLLQDIKKEAGTEGGKAQLHFEEIVKSNIAIYVRCLGHRVYALHEAKTALHDFRKEFKEDNPDNKKVALVAKEGGERWKSMTEEEKKPYIEKAAELKAEYEKAVEEENDVENEEDDANEEQNGEDAEDEKVVSDKEDEAISDKEEAVPDKEQENEN